MFPVCVYKRPFRGILFMDRLVKYKPLTGFVDKKQKEAKEKMV
jgi:hypothetical protein